jgi:hypothetical protein
MEIVALIKCSEISSIYYDNADSQLKIFTKTEQGEKVMYYFSQGNLNISPKRLFLYLSKALQKYNKIKRSEKINDEFIIIYEENNVKFVDLLSNITL